MPHDCHSLPDHCPNCAAPVHGPYCAQCGQETVHELPTLREFAHEYLHHYVAAEGKLLHTVRLLLLKPGQLTLEYVAGRRQRYVKPLSLYVTFSFMFFLVLSWTRDDPDKHMVVYQDNGHTQSQSTQAMLAQSAQAIASDAAVSQDATDKKVDSFVADAVQQLAQPGRIARLQEQLLHRLPYAVFVLMPLFAGLCALFYRRRHEPYGLHLLFTLHLHAFLFAFFLLCLIPGAEHLASWLPWLPPLYLIVALKRVHQGRWWPQVCRGLLMCLIYCVVSGLAVAAVAVLSSGLTWAQL